VLQSILICESSITIQSSLDKRQRRDTNVSYSSFWIRKVGLPLGRRNVISNMQHSININDSCSHHCNYSLHSIITEWNKVTHQHNSNVYYQMWHSLPSFAQSDIFCNVRFKIRPGSRTIVAIILIALIK
jgi:hypothetical protein